MGVNILVATPQAAFGELLRLSLEETGGFSVRLVQSRSEARSAVKRLHFDVAILDAGLAEPAFPAFAEALRDESTGLHLVIISPENTTPSYNGLHPDAVLSQPFYMPDLLEKVRGMVRSSPGPAAATPASTQTLNLKSPEELAEVLNQLLAPAHGMVQEVVVTHDLALYACGGRLDPAVVAELVSFLARFWKAEVPADLVRYLRPPSGRETLLYATPLDSGLVLLLACEANALITRVRAQAGRMAQSLRLQMAPMTPADNSQMEIAPHPTSLRKGEEQTHSPSILPVQNRGEGWGGGKREPGPEPAGTLASTDISQIGIAPHPTSPLLGEESETPAPAAEVPTADFLEDISDPGSPTSLTQDETEDLLRALEQASADEENGGLPRQADDPSLEVSLSDLLAAMPSPDPGPRMHAQPADWGPAAESEPQAGGFLFPWELETPLPVNDRPAEEHPEPAAQASPSAAEVAASLEQEIRSPGPSTEVTRQIRPPVPEGRLTSSIPASAGVLEISRSISDTRPNPATFQPQSQDLEPQPEDYAGLAYTCLLLPRLPHHRLQGPLADAISDWLSQICLAYGWRLAWKGIKPEYLMWTVNVSPSISPSIVVRLIRQLTSERVFERYAGLATDNPSTDFWAPGYLISSGAQPPDTELVRNYIRQTRKRQGLT